MTLVTSRPILQVVRKLSFSEGSCFTHNIIFLHQSSSTSSENFVSEQERGGVCHYPVVYDTVITYTMAYIMSISKFTLLYLFILNSIMTEAVIIQKPVQWTGFYKITASVMKELKKGYYWIQGFWNSSLLDSHRFPFHPQGFYKKCALKMRNINGKTPVSKSIFNKVVGCRSATLLKRYSGISVHL